MTIPLRQSTASQEIPLGPFLDTTNGNEEETDLTIANTDILLWKWGATSLVSKNSGGATHMQDGMYYCTLDATDSNTLGLLKIYVHVAGALYVAADCLVYSPNVYDSLFGSDKLEVDTVEVSGTSQTANDNSADINTLITRIAQTLNLTASGNIGIDWANVENPSTAVDLSATDIQLVDTVTTNTDMRGTDGAYTGTPPTVAQIRTEIDSNSTQLADIVEDTDELQSNQGDWATATGFSTLAESDIRNAVGLTTNNLDTQLAEIPTNSEFNARTIPSADYFDPDNDVVANVTLVDTTTENSDMRGTDNAALASALVSHDAKLDTVDTNIDTILGQTGTTGVQVADKTGYELSTSGVQAIWDRLTSALTTVGSIGKLFVDNINAAISSRSSHSESDVWTSGTRTLTANTNLNDLDAAGIRSAVGLSSANLDTQLSDLPTASENADAVWNETLSEHLGAGSTGEALNASGSAGDPWSTSLPGAYGAGSAGNILGNRLDQDITTTETNILAGITALENVSIADVQSALTAQGYTVVRSSYLDKLNVAGDLAHSDAANTYKADLTGISTFDASSETVDLGSILGTALTEGNAGDVANNVTQFFDVNPTSSQSIDDVGGGGGGGSSPWSESEKDQVLSSLNISLDPEREYTVTVEGVGTPIEGVTTYISTDINAANVIWIGVTDVFGVARTIYGEKPRLAAGTYYFWRYKSGFTPSNPDTEVFA